MVRSCECLFIVWMRFEEIDVLMLFEQECAVVVRKTDAALRGLHAPRSVYLYSAASLLSHGLLSVMRECVAVQSGEVEKRLSVCAAVHSALSSAHAKFDSPTDLSQLFFGRCVFPEGRHAAIRANRLSFAGRSEIFSTAQRASSSSIASIVFGTGPRCFTPCSSMAAMGRENAVE